MTASVPVGASPGRDIVIVHSSDLHVDHDYTARMHGGDGTAGLASVLSLARGANADVVVLAGDTFDCHRLPPELLDRTAEVIAASALPVVVLPGNHDPAVEDAVYHHGALAAVENLHVLGVKHAEAVVFSDLGLEIWGRPHLDYGDMIPFETRASAPHPLAGRGGARPLRAGARSQHASASVVADRRSGTGRDRRRLRGARALEPPDEGRQWQCRGLLLRLAGICRNRQRGPPYAGGRSGGDAGRTRHHARPVRRCEQPDSRRLTPSCRRRSASG